MAATDAQHGTAKRERWILRFLEVDNNDVGLVGGKNASLGEMCQQLVPKGVRVPNGFCVTASAYFDFLKRTPGLSEQLHKALDSLDKNDTRALERAGHRCRQLLMNAPLGEALEKEIIDAYRELSKEYGRDVDDDADGGADVAVRSSATAEDLPDASFAGQQETYLNIRGRAQLLFATRRCIASLFTNRAISYRIDKGFDHFSVGLSVGVQKMVRADTGSAGVLFTLDTESGHRDVCLVTGAWGLGENVVQGAVTPDEFIVHKPTLRRGHSPLVSKRLGTKEMRMVYADVGGTIPVKNVSTRPEDRDRFCVSDDEVLMLARWGVLIEDHYSRRRYGDASEASVAADGVTVVPAKRVPQDIEWARDGETGELFIVQARPETVHSQTDASVLTTYSVPSPDCDVAPVVTGHAVGAAIATGKVQNITDAVAGIHAFVPGSVLVTGMTDPDWEPVLKRAAAVVTNRGGRTCHAAIVSRELGIPCVVGCGDATDLLKSGCDVTVDCSRGEIGRIMPGKLKFDKEVVAVDTVPPLRRCRVMCNLANPERAFATSFLPQAGVGLARMEFIINSYIKAHPLALLAVDASKETGADVANVSAADRAAIDLLTRGYSNAAEYFVAKLAEGVGTICAAFWPKRVILRFSDFKSDEYASLLGGGSFEPVEANPMIGWRGASRYYDDKYKAAFHLECAAVRRVRERMGLTNLAVMIPFCRTVAECEKTLASMGEAGLVRGMSKTDPPASSADGGATGKVPPGAVGGDALKVFGMCEIPANVILADEFLAHLDGYSIGSNDLTQLVLGVDRNSSEVAHVFDERNDAVKRMCETVISRCRALGKYVGICGQAPSDFPEFAAFLVRAGIESVSLQPDTVVKTSFALAEVEKEMDAAEAKE